MSLERVGHSHVQATKDGLFMYDSSSILVPSTSQSALNNIVKVTCSADLGNNLAKTSSLSGYFSIPLLSQSNGGFGALVPTQTLNVIYVTGSTEGSFSGSNFVGNFGLSSSDSGIFFQPQNTPTSSHHNIYVAINRNETALNVALKTNKAISASAVGLFGYGYTSCSMKVEASKNILTFTNLVSCSLGAPFMSASGFSYNYIQSGSNGSGSAGEINFRAPKGRVPQDSASLVIGRDPLDLNDHNVFVIKVQSSSFGGSVDRDVIYISSSDNKVGFNTKLPLTEIDMRADEFQFQKRTSRRGIKINEAGDIESFNKDVSSANTGSEIILKYSRGTTVNEQMIEAVTGLAFDNDSAAQAYYNALDDVHQQELLFEAENSGFIVPPATGDVLGQIRWTAESGSIGSFDERVTGETAVIKAVVSSIGSDGVQADLIFSVAGKTGASVQKFLIDAGNLHQLTGSLNMGNGVLRAQQGIFSSNITCNGNIIGDNATVIQNVSHINAIGDLTMGNAVSDKHLFTGHITSSHNISSSGTITALSMSGDGSNLTGVTATIPAGTYSSSLQTLGNITSSGNISASGKITTNTLQINVTADGSAKVGNHQILHAGIEATADNVTVGTANNITAVATTDNAEFFVGILDGASGIQAVETSTKLKYNPSSAVLSVPGSISSSKIITSEIEKGYARTGITLDGNVTASGNISASGNIITSNVFMPGDAKISFDDALDGTDQFIAGGENFITIEGDNFVKFRADDHVRFQDNGGTVHASINPNAGHITSSGNISASGLITGKINTTDSNADAAHYFVLQTAADTLPLISNGMNLNPSNDVLTVGGHIKSNGHITASGNISSSGNIIADFYDAKTSGIGYKLSGVKALYVDGTTDVLGRASTATRISGSTIELGNGPTHHVTASGNISASGTITADQMTYGTPGDGHVTLGASDGDILGYETDHTTNKAFMLSNHSAGGKLSLYASNTLHNLLTYTGDSYVNGTNNANGFVVGGTSTDNKFEVVGTTKLGGHVTSSGNISASGEIRGKMLQPILCNFKVALNGDEFFLPLSEGENEKSSHTNVAVPYLAPYNGTLHKVLVRNAGDSNTHAYSCSLYTMDIGDSTKDLQAQIIKQADRFGSGGGDSGAHLIDDFMFTGSKANTITAGEAVVISLKSAKSSNLAHYVTAVFEWEYH